MQRGSVRLIAALVVLLGLAVRGGDSSLLASFAPSALAQDPCSPDDPAAPGCTGPDAAPAPVRPGTVLLEESFDDPGARQLGMLPRVPGQSEFAYVDGYLRARRLAEGGTAIVLLPHDADHDDATVAVSARLVDEVAGRYVVLGCRRQDTEAQSGYRLAVMPDSGMFTLVRRDAALEVALANWQPSGAIRRGAEWNRLELTCARSTIDAIINGQVVASVQDAAYPQGQALLGVGVFPGQGAPAEADFDDLLVTKR